MGCRVYHMKLTLRQRMKKVYNHKGNWGISLLSAYMGIAGSGLVLMPLAKSHINPTLLWSIWSLLTILFMNVILLYPLYGLLVKKNPLGKPKKEIGNLFRKLHFF